MQRNSNTLRFVPTIVGLVVFGIIVMLYAGATPLYYIILRNAGIVPWSHPFIDGEFMYAMKRCWKAGVDVYASVPCDVVPHNKMAYSPLWQRLPFLPTDNAARVPIGLATDLLLLLSVAILPPARSARDAVLLSLAIVSTMVCFALERNNIDVWIYLVILVGTLLFIRSGMARGLAYAAFMIAGLLKYYPFLLFVLAFKERPTRFWLVVASSTAALGIFVGAFWSELMKSLLNIPKASPFGDMVGIANLPLAFVRLMANVTEMSSQERLYLTLLCRLLLTVTVIIWAIRLARRPDFTAVIDGLAERDRIWLSVGALVMGGCYLLTQNDGYRGIYLLIVLSSLLAVCRTDKEIANRLQLLPTALLIVPIMWMEGIRYWTRGLAERVSSSQLVHDCVVVLVWLARELLWLNLEHVLLAVVFVVAANSPTGLAIIAWMRRSGTSIAGFRARGYCRSLVHPLASAPFQFVLRSRVVSHVRASHPLTHV